VIDGIQIPIRNVFAKEKTKQHLFPIVKIYGSMNIMIKILV
jgi:hypothetical protein